MTFSIKKILLVVFISLVFTELLLKVFDYRSGYWGKFDGFYVVDSLLTFKNFTTDEYGIYKFSSWVTDSLQRDYNWRTGMIRDNTPSQQAILPWDLVNYVYTSYTKLKYLGEQDLAFIGKVLLYIGEGEEDWDTEFTEAYNEIKQKTELNNWEIAIKNYVANPFNNDGFRSIEFKVHDTTRTRILLIGDSFAYGMSARPLFNSYPDLLLVRGYEVYNTGIPGVDPAQYAAVAKKYIPLLQPDIVLLNFSDMEDLMYFPRKAEKGKPHEHFTNAGTFNSYPLGEYLSPKEAYDYYASLIKIPYQESKIFNRVCSISGITSLLWGYFLKKGFFEHPRLNEYYNYRGSFRIDSAITITKKHLAVIDSICVAHHVPLINVVIPDKPANYNKGRTFMTIDKASNDQLFSKHYYHPADMFTEGDYYQSQDHFNNIGSLKFANYLEKIIQEYE